MESDSLCQFVDTSLVQLVRLSVSGLVVIPIVLPASSQKVFTQSSEIVWEQLGPVTHGQSLEKQAHLQVARDSKKQYQPYREKTEENQDDRHTDTEEKGTASEWNHTGFAVF